MTVPDGFALVNPESYKDLAKNTGGLLNEYSAFANCHEIVRASDEVIVDRHYGLAYHRLEFRPAAIYGWTEDLPDFSGDSLANYGFLRVPFRRIPRRIVRSRTEIEELLANIKFEDPNLQMLFRGQTSEHRITRSSETSQLLFGKDAVLEPSLTTSASRRAPALEDVLPEWCVLLRSFIADLHCENKEKLFTSFAYPLFALALAQHYGLPTSGLDVTDRLEVALFFAQMKYEKPAGGYNATYMRNIDSSRMPVLYILFPPKQQQFDYEGYRPKGFPCGRPDAQAARFMHMAWGHADNICASRIFLALYLDPAGDFGSIPSPEDLFPKTDTDLFAGFLERARTLHLPDKLAQILADGFYLVTT
jgi:hypothetical protein